MNMSEKSGSGVFHAAPIRSKPGMGIKINKRESNYNGKLKVSVRSTVSTSIRKVVEDTNKVEGLNIVYSGNSSPRSSVKNNVNNKPVVNECNVINDIRLVELRDKFYEDDDFSQTDSVTLQSLLTHLRYYSTDKVIKRDYDEAERADILSDKIRRELALRKSENRGIYSEDYEAVMSRKLDHFVKDLDRFDKSTSARMSELIQKQRTEMDDLERRWVEEYPKKYRKPSTKLLSLIENERKVGLSGNYKLARQLKKQTDEMRRLEAEIAQERLNKDYIAARERLIEKHNNERRKLEEQRKAARQILVTRQGREMTTSLNRGAVLTLKDSMNKVREPGNTSSPSGKFGTAQVLGESEVEILLPPLAPPDYNAIKVNQQERAKQAEEKGRLLTKKLKERSDAKKMKISRLLSTPASRVPKKFYDENSKFIIDSANVEHMDMDDPDQTELNLSLNRNISGIRINVDEDRNKIEYGDVGTRNDSSSRGNGDGKGIPKVTLMNELQEKQAVTETKSGKSLNVRSSTGSKGSTKSKLEKPAARGILKNESSKSNKEEAERPNSVKIVGSSASNANTPHKGGSNWSSPKSVEKSDSSNINEKERQNTPALGGLTSPKAGSETVSTKGTDKSSESTFGDNSMNSPMKNASFDAESHQNNSSFGSTMDKMADAMLD